MDEESIFAAALEKKTPEERGAFLDEACAGDAQLRANVESLLKAHEEARGFLEPDADGPEATLGYAPVRERPGTIIGRYKLMEEIGEGGMGVVFVAEQQEPVRRKVALKIIKPGMDTKEVVARFEAERQALAMMDHPNIARVLDAGATESGRPYFVMELVRGIPITDYCDKANLTTWERLELFVSVCHAIQHAHQKGIIHRDVKPTNVLVTLRDGTPIPKVIDFGVAKAINQRLTERTVYTRFAQMVGTPLYMSPEQAEMSELDVDTRSDVYSLGVLLYELLTGTTPFDRKRIREAAYDQLLKIIREEEPPKPSTRISTLGETAGTVSAHRKTEPKKLGQLLRGDLDWIVMKAMEKDRTRRYETANGFARDIQRYLSDEPVSACPPSAAYRFRKFARRNKVLLTTVALVGAVLLLGAVISTWQAFRATWWARLANDRLVTERNAHKETALARAAETEQRIAAEEARNEAERLREQTRRSLYLAHLQMAQQAASDPGQAGRLQGLLGQWRPEPDVPDLRDWEWYFLNAQRHQEQATLHGHTYGVGAVAWSPDGRRFASASLGGIVKIWNAQTREEEQTLYGHSTDVCPLAWSPDGQKLASAGADSSVMVWDAVAGDELPLLSGQGRQLLSVAWSPDGTRLASAWRAEGIRICDAATGRELTAVPAYGSRVYSMAWHPNGKWLASAGENAPIHVWDVQTGQQVIELPGHAHIVFCLQWSPEGKRLASGSCSCDKTTVKVWEPPATEPVLTFTGHVDNVRSVAWSPDGRHLASASSDRTARIFSAATGEEIQALRGHSGEVESVCWSPDGGCLFTSSRDRTIKFWDPTPQTGATTLEGHADSVGTVAWSPDGGRLASASDDGTVRIWERETREAVVTLSGHTDKVQSVCWSPGGDRVASVGSDNTLRIWSVQTGEQLQAAAAHPDAEKGILCVCWSPEGTRIATSASDRLITIWDADSGKELRTLRGHGGSVRSASFSPDSTRLASAGAGGTIRLWDVASGVETATLRGPRETIRCVVFSLDGNRLILAGGRPLGTLTRAGAERGTIRLWDLSTREQTVVLHGHTDLVRAVCWSPEGGRLASASADGTVKVWEVTSTGGADTGWELLTLDAHPDGAYSVSWSPDGMSIASAGAEGNVKIWDAEPGYAFERSPELLSKLDRKVTGGAATAADLKLRAEILAQEGRWEEAAADFDRAAEMLGEAAPGWFMTPFWVAGPYPEDLRAEYPPERSTDPHTPIPGVESWTSEAVSTRQWHLAAVAQNEPINFANYFERADRVSGYAMTRVYATHDQKIGILLGADDTVRLWLGGQLAHEHESARVARPDQDAVRVSLKAGWNTVLAKVVNVTGEHGLFLRLSDQPVELAQAYWNSGLRKEALEQLDRAVAADPEMAALRFMRGSREMQMGLFDRGEADFAKAIELLPGKALPYVTRANAYWGLRHYDKALADLNTAIEMMPDAPRLHVLRGGWHARRGHWQQGEADLTKAMELSPTDHWIAYQLAALRAYVGEEKKYDDLRLRMLADWGDTSSPVVAERTAKACLLLPPSDDELRHLIELADRAVAAGPDHGLYGYFLLPKGMAEYRAARFPEAVEALKESLEHTATWHRHLNTLDHLLLAMSYHKSGQAEEAREAFDQAHQIITNEFPEIGEDDLGASWHDPLMCLIVLREAAELIAGPRKDPTPQAKATPNPKTE